MSKHHHHAETGKASIKAHQAVSDSNIEHKDDSQNQSWAEREAAECWKGICKTGAAAQKEISKDWSIAQDKFEHQPEWAKILEGTAVAAVVLGGAAKWQGARNAAENEAVQNTLRKAGVQSSSSTFTKTAMGESHIEHKVKYGDGSSSTHLLDPESRAGRQARQNGLADAMKDRHDH